MHSIAPYSLRCVNPTLPNTHLKKNASLGAVGQHDFYEVLKSFVEENSDGYTKVEDTKQIFRFKNVEYDEDKRSVCGWFALGSYGNKTDIIDIENGKVEYVKGVKNAEMISHFFSVYVPKDYNEAIFLLHLYRGNGFKTVFYDKFCNYVLDKTKHSFHMNPLSNEEAFHKWYEGQAKEIKLVKFQALKDIADEVRCLGHHEEIVTLKPNRKGVLGKLSDYFGGDEERTRAVEILSGMCESVKTTVVLKGRKRTFRVGVNSTNTVCEIESPENLAQEDGNPTHEAMKKWCSQLIEEYKVTMYRKE